MTYFIKTCGILIVLTAGAASIALAQNKFYSSPGRAGNERENAQIQALMDETAAQGASLTTLSNCGDQGKFFGPNHTLADGSDCVPSLSVAADGLVAVETGIRLGGYTTCDPQHEGTLRYNTVSKRIEFCDGDTWAIMGSGAGCDFTFPAVADATVNTFYNTSDAVYSSPSATASVSGGTGATIRKGSADTGLSSGVTIDQGNTVGIRGQSASSYNQTTIFTLDIGSYTACWNITTKEQDAVPNGFTFTDLTNQSRNAVITSNAVTMNGFDGPLTVSITGDGGAQLQINSGSWASSGNIYPGDTVKLKLTSAPGFDTVYAATLVAGPLNDTWTVRTELDGFPAGTFIRAGGHYNQGCPPSLSSCGGTLPIQQSDKDVCASRSATYRQVRQGENGCGGPDWGHCEIVCQ